jgi:hypothetical protein
MQLRAFLLLVSFLFCSTLFAQTVAGVWEGSLLVNGSKKQKLNVRIELMEQDGVFVGIINTRGFDKNTAYGCDYVVTGNLQGTRVQLKRKSVRRGISMSDQECLWFREADLRIQKTNNGEQVSGNWIWMNDQADAFTATKSQDSVSEVTKDEIADYVEDTYLLYEQNNVLLPAGDRLNKTVATISIDSSDLVLDFSSLSPSVHDSITILFNGEPISHLHDLNKAPLRIRLKALPYGRNELILVSQSVAQNKLKILLELKHQGKSQQFTLQPGFTRNEVLFFNRKQE